MRAATWIWCLLALGVAVCGVPAATAAVPGPWHLQNGTTVFVLDITSESPLWQSTGVMVTAETRLMIRVLGEANTAGWNQSYPWVAWAGPGGLLGSMADSNHPLPGVPRWSVIGRLGDGAPFFVGDGGILGGPGSEEGELFLGYNDHIFSDNFGYYLVYISVAEELQPGDAPASGHGPELAPLVSARTWPNPTDGLARIECALPAAGPVSIDVYDVSGRLVRRFQDHAAGPGRFEVTWDGLDNLGQKLPNGNYLYRVTQGDLETTGKMVWVR